MNCESCGHENLQEAHFCAKCGVQLASNSDEKGWIGRLVGGRFRVKRVLGEGGMGIVYEGEQQMGSKVRRVAIKTLHSHLSSDTSVLARFHRECGTVSSLEHPNTIKFYDFGSADDGTLYIAMEFIDGKSLDDLIQQEGALSPDRVVKILSQICGALDEAHDQGIIHRDLKPENIVLTERLGKSDFVKVLDFGIAARTESADAENEAKLTQQGMVLGTPPYMSPEQFTGVELDRRSDVYSLGCMAYEMLTAHLPFTANTPWQWATQHMTVQPAPIGETPSGAAVPVAMRTAVMQALAKEPDDRPATAGKFLKALEDGLAISASAVSAPTEQMQAVPLGASRASALPTTQAEASSEASKETQATMAATQAIEATPKKNKSSTPVIVAALLAVLGLGGAAAVMMGNDPPEEAEADGAESALADSEEAPSTADAQAEENSAPDPQPSLNPSTKDEALTVRVPSPDAGSPSTKTGASSSKTSPRPGPKPSASASPKVDCGKCLSFVKGGNLSAAASIYQQCAADPSARATCSAQARKVAPGLTDAAVKKGNCAQARGLASSAKKLGASSQRLRRSVKKCQ